MSKSQSSSRLIVSRITLFSVIGGSLLLFMAAGSNAAGFTFVNSVKEFLGLPVVSAKADPSKTNGERPNAAPVKANSSATSGETQQSGMIVGRSYHNDTSPPLRDMVQLPITPHSLGEGNEANKNPEIFNTHVDRPDPVVQSAMAPSAMPTPIQNFDGIPFPGVVCNCAPPDTDGEVGSTQYVQMVNEGYQVFDKATGASVLGPSSINSLWAGFGGVCQSGSGDPIVLFDQIANRWLISQFAGSGVPTDECIAISQTADATGAYNRYAFHLGSNFFDYPHIGMWPDGYYMSDNVFNSAGTARLGTQAFVFDRAAMIAGLPATFITPGLTPGGNAEPYALAADLDGSVLPPAGTPCPFVAWPSNGTYKTYLFHADFVTPANSTYTLRANPPAAAGFTSLCSSTRNCVPQLGSTGNLDDVGDRFMHRLPYRIVDGVERIVGNYTVSSGGVAGIRWVELRNVTSGTETVFQESTYQPDTTWRWMGSAAQDTNGNLAIGFSASDATINPQVRYAGRLAIDPPNTLAQGEETLFAGTGSQTGSGNRWGDYSALSIDPVDDCTFWYTQEYYATTSAFNWRTRIGSFKFQSCSQTPSFTLEATPTSQDICAGTNAMYTVNTTSIQMFSDPVTLTATGNPAGTTATFSPNPVTPGGNSTLTIGNTAGVAAGSYTINVQGTSGAIMLDQNITLNVYSAAPGAPTLTAPANGATNQSVAPTFTFTAGTQSISNTLEIATDAGFSNIVHTASGLTGTSYSGASLNAGTNYFWRVRGTNTCGVGSNSAAFSFTTTAGNCNENFDGVTAPALPAGWVATNIVPGPSPAPLMWATSTTMPDTAPNSLFIDDADTISDKFVDSPGIPINSAAAQISFRNNFNTEFDATTFWDGGVLEISSPNINGGAFTDVTAPAVGGSFVTGGYTGTLDSTANNPLAGRMAWSGNSGGYIDTVINLGPNVAGQTIRLRFRIGSDEAVSAPGWWVDSISITGGCMAGTPSPTGTATSTATSTPTNTPTATPTSTPPPSCPATITQSTSQTVVPGSVACTTAGVGSTQNSYWRAFTLSDFGVPAASTYNVSSVSFGVETVTTSLPITVNLYTTTGFPTGFPGSLTLIGTAMTTITTVQGGTVVNVPLAASVPPGTSQLVMEVNAPDGTPSLNFFFIGSNTAAETGPSYLSAADCGITTPTTTAAIGFPNMHIIMNVNGSCPTGGTPSPTATATATATSTTTPSPSPTCSPGPWQSGPAQDPARYAIQGALGTDNMLYIAGGQSADATPVVFDQVSRFDPATNTWSNVAPLPTAVSQAATGAANGKIFVVGGFTGGSSVTNILQIYDIATNTWSTGASIPTPAVEAAASAVVNGKFYVMGGDDFNNGLNTTFIYDIATNVWTTGATLPDMRTNLYGTVSGGMIYVYGGVVLPAFTTTDTLLRYDPVANTWTNLGSAGTAGARGNYGGISPFGAGQLLITDGANSAGVSTMATHIFTIGTGTFSAGPAMIGSRAGHAQGTLPDGRIIVADGFNTASTTTSAVELIAGSCSSPTPTATATSTPTNTATATATATSTPTGSPTPMTTFVTFRTGTGPNGEFVQDESQTASIIVDRGGITTGTSVINFATSDGTAIGGAACGGGVDYMSVNQMLTFNPGDTQKTVLVPICPDSLVEATFETINLTLTGADVMPPGTGVLLANDTANDYLNTASIDMTLGAAANPYPSTITVSNGPPQIGGVRVTFYDVSHVFPDNIDALLVGPGGQKFVLMGDSGGSLAIDPNAPVTLTFSDAAGAVLPDSAPLTTGMFEPTNWETPVTDFPLPAPAGPYNEPGSAVGGSGVQTFMGNFGLMNSNGVWSLYVRDDGGLSSPTAITGSFAGGWGLQFITSTAAGASISGHVTTSDGRGIRNARITVSGNSLSEPRIATTGSFGYFTFDGLTAGETYVVTVNSQRYTFTAPSRVISLVDNVVDADFTADPQE